jgi:GTP-binding protein
MAPASKQGKNVKIKYGLQTGTKPPKFTLFCNYPELIHFSYVRRIENHFRKAFDLNNVKIVIKLKKS